MQKTRCQPLDLTVVDKCLVYSRTLPNIFCFRGRRLQNSRALLEMCCGHIQGPTYVKLTAGFSVGLSMLAGLNLVRGSSGSLGGYASLELLNGLANLATLTVGSISISIFGVAVTPHV
jgi:hypothetical protein